MLAKDLFDALEAAGSTICDDPHGSRIDLEKMTLSASAAQYDDASIFQTFPAPNVVARGADAKTLIDAIAAAGIDDCDPTRNAYLICNALSGAPDCGYQWLPFVKVGASELLPSCGPVSGVTPGGTLTAAASLAVWQSILRAAKNAGYQPSSGTIDQTTVVNARYFSWDGSNLGFTLVTGNASPPTPN